MIYPHYDCMVCGACCSNMGNDEWHVRLSTADTERLMFTRDTRWTLCGVFLRTDRRAHRDVPAANVCIYYDESWVHERGWHNCRCLAYQNRPDACRAIEIGSPLCLLARMAHGLLTLEELLPISGKVNEWVQCTWQQLAKRED